MKILMGLFLFFLTVAIPVHVNARGGATIGSGASQQTPFVMCSDTCEEACEHYWAADQYANTVWEILMNCPLFGYSCEQADQMFMVALTQTADAKAEYQACLENLED